MGTFRHTVEVARDPSGPFVPIEAMVDTGATFSQFARSILAPLGVTPLGQRTFTLADGRRVMREIAAVTIRLEGNVLPTVCIIADDGQPALLGAVTLETFGLAADPVNRRLVPAELFLLRQLRR
jgi:clan AA aspartic protease